MGSENPTGADNQQETNQRSRLDPNWVVGFVDGEGCFSVAIAPRGAMRVGWEVRPSVSVSQNADRAEVLDEVNLSGHVVVMGSPETIKTANKPDKWLEVLSIM